MQVNIKSLEDVVRKYIQMAEDKTEAARVESHQVVIDVDDLDVPDTPERYFSSEWPPGNNVENLVSDLVIHFNRFITS